ncbi:uncharacterized protein LOC120693183 isoform X3 [Panicum virgatum]|uniref:Uncharacterized protein n=1 Tax=Panicum virgatum TaxID=38727 RepID=A0A8T0MSQ6_PANVG|nr:uncharacterized protein LOC120693183 isoform X3 [Panicum virgatum]KAG2537806.1 hypothetical protein PVAP13_9NG388773 [Panicum virgatum]
MLLQFFSHLRRSYPAERRPFLPTGRRTPPQVMAPLLGAADAAAWRHRRRRLAPPTPPYRGSAFSVLASRRAPPLPATALHPLLLPGFVSPTSRRRRKRRPESEPIAGHVPPRQGTDQQPHYHGTARRGHTSPTSITRCMYFISARPLCCFLLLRFDKHFLLVELIYTNGSVDF